MLDNRSNDRTGRTTISRRPPLWLLGTALAALIAAALAALAVFGGATLPERTGPPIEELTVERAVLSPGTIALTVRGAGADPVQVAQVTVNDVFVDFTGGEQPVDRLTTATLVLDVPWQDGQPYLIGIITSTGLVIEHEIPAAVATPEAGSGVVTTMVLLGTYVGILPVLLGMLVLPVLRRAGTTAVRVLLALTVGLLAFLAVDASLDGLELLAGVGEPFGGAAVVLLGAALAYLALAGVDGLLNRRRHMAGASPGRPGGLRLAVLIAVGIGLHNLGEGLAIGSAFAVGELALGTALVVGFALHNTTEGLAIVAPLTERRPGLPALLGLGLLAGAPAVLGALLGAAVDNPVLSALLLGVGVGAIIGVIGQIVPALRGRDGRLLDPPVAGGLTAGIVIMYLTGLLVAA